MYDIITIWWWASGLRTNIWLPKNSKKLILEKTNKLGQKLLLSGGKRCNFSNINCDIQDYTWENKNFLHSIFHRFDNNDMINWIEKNWIKTSIEDNGRVLLKGGHSEEILDLFTKKIKDNNVNIKMNTSVSDIKYENNMYTIYTDQWEFKSKKIIISTGGKSFPQLWTDGNGFEIATKLDIWYTLPYKWLCWTNIKEDISELSWTSIFAKIKILDNKKIINQNEWKILFTHFGLSWPVIFDSMLKLGEYCRKQNINSEKEYIQQNIYIQIELNQQNITKRIQKYWNISDERKEIELKINDLRSWKEAKVTWWGIKLKELKNNMESRKYPWLFWIWEVVDITGKTGGYNLQWCWSSWFVCAKSIKES